MNDTERMQWVDNDEGLYNLWRGSGQSRREFVRANRAELDAAIGAVRSGRQPAHFLAYGGRPDPAPQAERYGAAWAANRSGRSYGRAGQSLMPGVF